MEIPEDFLLICTKKECSFDKKKILQYPIDQTSANVIKIV